jgi:hypothetical protein
MRNWKTGQSSTVEEMLDDLGGDWRSKYDLNQALTVAELRAFLGALALTEDGPVSYTPEGLARLIEQLPDRTRARSAHVRSGLRTRDRSTAEVDHGGTPDLKIIQVVRREGPASSRRRYQRPRSRPRPRSS